MSARRVTAYGLMLLVSLIWGVAGPVIKFTLGDLPPLIFLMYRFGLSSIAAAAMLLVTHPHHGIKRKDIGIVALYGFLTSTVTLGLLFLGFDKTTSLTGVLLSAAGPVLTVIAGTIFLHEHVTRAEWTGLSIAFAGAVVSVVTPLIAHDGNQFGSLEGNLLIVGSLVVGVVTAILAKLILRDDISPASLTNISFIIGFVTITPIAIYYHGIREIVTVIAHAPLAAHLGAWYMAFLSGTLAYTLYHKAQKPIQVGEISIFSYLMPIWAMPLSVIWLGEKITTAYLIGAGIIAAGVTIAEYKRRTRPAVLPAHSRSKKRKHRR